MNTREIDSKVNELRELRCMADELAAEIEAIQDVLKCEMAARNAEEICGTDWRISWEAVKSTRLDTAALRKACPDLAAQFTRTTDTRRFCIA